MLLVVINGATSFVLPVIGIACLVVVLFLMAAQERGVRHRMEPLPGKTRVGIDNDRLWDEWDWED